MELIGLDSDEDQWYLPDTILAIATMSAADDRSINDVNVISTTLAKLKEEGIELGDISIQRDASGFYSEQFDQFLTYIELRGGGKRFNPINLNDKGRRLCENLIRRFCEPNKRQMIEPVAKVFNINLDTYCPR
ncbi:MAG: hypothetical protein WC382_09625 [Methanoregulaceae archaeon]|jgi:hypothetical protein